MPLALLARVHDLLAWLSALTLGQIWAAVYSPPDKPWKIALVVVALAYRAPEYYARWCRWRLGRRVVPFAWDAPKVCCVFLIISLRRRSLPLPRPLPVPCAIPRSRSLSLSPHSLRFARPLASAHIQEASSSWHGEVIQQPDLFAHDRDASLLLSHATGSFITCYDPSTGEHIETRRLLPAADVAAQVAQADAAQPAWARTSFAARCSVLRSIKAWILRDMDQIVAVACRDTGKTRVDAVFGEILTTLAKIDWLVKYGEKTLKPERRAMSLLLAHKISEVS